MAEFYGRHRLRIDLLWHKGLQSWLVKLDGIIDEDFASEAKAKKYAEGMAELNRPCVLRVKNEKGELVSEKLFKFRPGVDDAEADASVES